MEAAPRSTVGPAWSDHRVYEEPSTWTDDSAAHYTGEDFFDDLNPDCTYVDDRLGRPHKLLRSPILPVHHTDGGPGARGREAANLPRTTPALHFDRIDAHVHLGPRHPTENVLRPLGQITRWTSRCSEMP